MPCVDGVAFNGIVVWGADWPVESMRKLPFAMFSPLSLGAAKLLAEIEMIVTAKAHLRCREIGMGSDYTD